MKLLNWQFRLEGDEFDIQSLTALFVDGVKFVRHGNGHRYLSLDLPFTSAEAQAAHNAAEELIAKLNGIAQMTYGNHKNVKIGAMACRAMPDQPMTQVILAGGIRSRSRLGSVRVVLSDATPPTPVVLKPIGDRLLDIADKDEYFERALYLYGSLLDDWRGLYMVLEAIEDGNGGEAALIAKQWVHDGKIKDFKKTANSYKAIRAQARHGSVSRGILQPKQTLDEAREIIRTILERLATELE